MHRRTMPDDTQSKLLDVAIWNPSIFILRGLPGRVWTWLTSRGRVNPFILIPAAGDPKHTLIKKGNVGNEQFKNHGP